VAGESERYLCHMLVGRGPECARIDELLADARQGRAGTLVLRGEAGIGKGALLACTEERAGGMISRVLGLKGGVDVEDLSGELRRDRG
jgi:hypothetical protein